ncbi:MAG: outer membrane protein assembly factor BamD [Pseudomonadota bacterium]|nr:outer membrane protein assembly factor BamD [Gammaproteobacteria bacterium]MBU1559001.1 outer membrane protein assembly factor BamD [Gammaproteobacteria bacterium]MBU1926360.1 outer membrane protein assembly factor BamD [Gammaproteobacteria bacterium]MBU2545887.1 outer membrane protein assembly factor BamD [Gammaproteobacteria bacterium]
MKLKLSVVLAIVACFLVGCSSKTPDIADLYKDQTEAQIYNAGVYAMKKADYDEAVKRFAVVNVRYPFGPYTRQSQLNTIYSYDKAGNSALALAAADRYLRLYPTGPDADYAYYMRGRIYFAENHSFFDRHFDVDFAKRDTTGMKHAYHDFSVLVHSFPKSPYAADARQRMVYIRNALARHELEVAQFYYGYQSYVAAANRANNVVQHYQGAPSVPDALVVMVRSYRKLGLMKESNDALQVLKLNYLNSNAYKKFEISEKK